MRVINRITVARRSKPAVIQLLHGDLSAIPPEHQVDILVVSAFPNDYNALPGSLMLALEEKGLSVREEATHKAVDLRSTLGCWLSEPLPPALQERLHFKKVLCFEPGTHSDDPVSVVGNIFRCLNNFVYDQEITRVAMPIIASGYQKVPLEKMIPALIETGWFWLEQGLPLDCINIVVFQQERVEQANFLFQQAKVARTPPLPAQLPELSMPRSLPPPERSIHLPSLSRAVKGFLPAILKWFTSLLGVNRLMSDESGIEIASPADRMPTDDKLDYFISYAHTQTREVAHFVELLAARRAGLRIFYDRTSLPPGGLWIKQLSDAIGKADKVLVFMSADYSASMVCWDEFQCAKLKEYNTRLPVIQTIYLSTDPQLPHIMGIHSYIDCRESDLTKLANACKQLIP